MCRQRPHGTGGKHSQLLCLIIGTLKLHIMGSVQYRLWTPPLVSIWGALPDLPAGGLIGKIRGSPRYVHLLRKIVTQHQQTSALTYFRPFLYLGCCNSGTMPWRRKATAWYLQPLTKVWWRGGGGYNYLGLIPWSCAHQFHSCDEIPPHSRLSIFRRFGLNPWTGDLGILNFTPYRRRLWTRGWLTSARRLPWPGGFPHPRFPSWGERSSSRSKAPKIQWMPIILHGLDTQWPGGVSSGWVETLWSIEVMAPGLVSKGFLVDPPERLPLVFHGLLWEFSNRQATQGGGVGGVWNLWSSWVLSPS